MANFQEIADDFRRAGALVQVETAAHLGRETLALFEDEPRRVEIGRRARTLVDRNRGARAATVAALAALVA
jgi:3-deoxy-D-manno-octulosonic-acid transferase